jgi:hypothetical protein
MQQLPQELEEMITRQWREGVYLNVERRRHLVTGINWRRSDPNVVAEMILNHVGEEEMPLILDGHKFMIRKVA